MATEGKMLVVACPRSGTMYATKYLRHKGFCVAHEHLQKHGAVAWQAVVQSGDMPWVPIEDGLRERHRFDWVVSLHRHPLSVVGSLVHVTLTTGDRESFLDYVKRYVILPDPSDGPLAEAVWFWVGWNKLILARDPEDRFRIENEMDKLVAFFSERLKPGESLCPPPTSAENHRGEYKPVSVEDVKACVPGPVAREFLEIAGDLGYRM